MALQDYTKPAPEGLMGVNPEQQARIAAARQRNQQNAQTIQQAKSRYGTSVPESQYRMQMQAWNQAKAQGSTQSFDDFMGDYTARFGRTNISPSAGGATIKPAGDYYRSPPLDPHTTQEIKPAGGTPSYIRQPPPDPHAGPQAPPQAPTQGPQQDPANANFNDSGQNDQRTRDYNSPGFTYDTGSLPGFSEGIDYNSTNDMFNTVLSAVTSRDDFDTGGNSLTEGGEWSAPDWMRNQDTALVEDRLNALMRGDSEYLKIAADRANEQAAERGMLGSSVAAGNAVRAMREAALPIAQSDADALNRQTLQTQGLMSNLYDSASARRWTARENNTERATQLLRDEMGFRRGVLDREDRQSFDYMNREDAQQFDAWQADLNRGFQQQLEGERLNWQGSQNELDRQQSRRMAYFETMFGREGMLSNVLNGIYMNPNLTPEQARQASENARALFTGLWEATNRTFAQGIPEIFDAPYQMEQEEPANP